MYRRLISHFVRGVIVVVPLMGLFFIGKYLYETVVAAAPIWESPELNFVTAILILLVGIFLVGLLAASVIAKPFIMLLEEFLNRAPIFKFVYSSIKDLMEAFVGEKKRFNAPVLVNIVNETEVQRFGFLTERDLYKLGPECKGNVAVYIPMSYSVSGNLYIVPARLVTPLPNVDPAELMKFLLAGGVTDLEDVLKKDVRKAVAPAQTDAAESK